ncbi:MAG: hypothetical protein ACJ704_15475 [Nitrososphaeraceae archaeon]
MAPNQKEKYFADIASGATSRPPIPSSMLGISDSKMSEWVQERLTPHPHSTYEDPPPIPDDPAKSASIPSTYIHCSLGPLSSWMEPFAARSRKFKWDVYAVEAGHDVMITDPNKLAEILLQIANRLHVFKNVR